MEGPVALIDLMKIGILRYEGLFPAPWPNTVPCWAGACPVFIREIPCIGKKSGTAESFEILFDNRVPADAQRLEVLCLLEAQSGTAEISCIKHGERRFAGASPADLPAIFPYRRATIR